MRFIGVLLALGVIGWFLFQGSGGEQSEGVIPEGYNQSLEKAQGVEQNIQDAAEARMKQMEDSN